ncbi:SMC-Scp complex subunit ScpB [Paenibacillus antri]|uniref:Segregation and condensation protein B n=1 Tax=Paenibacillus antri TaxID=2582848 RepID=A0A5R9GF94_9BACL|nr:SMC-Scp complex subunit ScpB [Paenibacillus antri]TLS53046.1 SMC-Scp complex subunit ScpB [Paenibacillus antri]
MTKKKNWNEWKSIIEGLLFAAGDEGLDVREIADVLELDWRVAEELIDDMKDTYAKEKRGFRIAKVAGSYQLTTNPEHAPYFAKLAQAPTRGSLSQAALETLAIVAYRQPITRVEIDEIRGVKSDRALHTLVAKELIHEAGRADAIGRPILYETTKQFLHYFGLSALRDLPDAERMVGEIDLEAETRMLFEKLEEKEKQITIDDLPQSSNPENDA